MHVAIRCPKIFKTQRPVPASLFIRVALNFYRYDARVVCRIFIIVALASINIKFNHNASTLHVSHPRNPPERRKARSIAARFHARAVTIAVRGGRPRTKRVYLLIENYEAPWCLARWLCFITVRVIDLPVASGAWIARNREETARRWWATSCRRLDRLRDDEAEQNGQLFRR